MRKFITFFLIIQSSVVPGQQQIKNFVQKNEIAVSTISPDSITYNDLVSIGNAIGDAGIVMLGEQDHGDAATFEAKTRLIKYLHEKKGFNVLAFESDFFGLNDGWNDAEKSPSKIDSFLKDNVLSLWADCNTCTDLLYNYIPGTQKSNAPIIVTGFDNQTVYTYSRKYLIKKLDSVLREFEIPITKTTTYQSGVLPLLDTLVTKFGYQLPSNDFFSACGDTLEIIKEEVGSKMPDDRFWLLVIDNLIAFNKEESYFKKDEWEAESIRDKQMFLNLQWVIHSKYPNQKVVVWAANNHIARYTSNKYITMGQYLYFDTSLKAKIYSIGFTSKQGTSGRLWEKNFVIDKPKNNSLENWINDSIPYAFMDFTAFNKKFPGFNEEFNMRGWRYQSFKNQWDKAFDGLFYIKEMYPCEDIKNSR
jgi:erythromycin esterase